MISEKRILEAISNGIKSSFVVDIDPDFDISFNSESNSDETIEKECVFSQLFNNGIYKMIAYEFGFSNLETLVFDNWTQYIDENMHLCLKATNKYYMDLNFDTLKLALADLVSKHKCIIFYKQNIDNLKNEFYDAWTHIKNMLKDNLDKVNNNLHVYLTSDKRLMIIESIDFIKVCPTYYESFPSDIFQYNYKMPTNNILYKALKECFKGDPNKIFTAFHFLPEFDDNNNLYLKIKYTNGAFAKKLNINALISNAFANKDLNIERNEEKHLVFTHSNRLCIEFNLENDIKIGMISVKS